MTRCAVLGSPIAHSLSPVLHEAAYDALGLSGWSYEAVQVDEVGLAAYLDGLGDEWRGLSLTMPLKRTVLGLLDSVSPVAELAGAVNTVLLSDGLRVGDNTDVPGAVAAIRERHDEPVREAVILGGGATAASMVLALADLGVEQITLAVRDATRVDGVLQAALRRGGPTVRVVALTPDAADASADTSADTASELGLADLVVSTIPATAQSEELVARLSAVPVVFEVVYDGWPTPLAAAVGDDRVLVSGLDLLVQQAVRQVALMVDVDVEHCRDALPAMRAAGERALAALVGPEPAGGTPGG